LPEISLLSFEPGDLQGILKYITETGDFLQLVRIGAIMSKEHVEIAFSRSKRAMQNGVGARDPRITFMMFLTGSHQASVALKRGGLKEGDSRCFAVYTDFHSLDRLAIAFPGIRILGDGGIPDQDLNREKEMFSSLNSVDLRIHG
jgi:tRNA threonylcarbamoyladenosine modification (KEOPS) complex Cgi121 subunit